MSIDPTAFSSPTNPLAHEVHSREFGEDRGSPFARPEHTVGSLRTSPAWPLPCTAPSGSWSPMVTTRLSRS